MNKFVLALGFGLAAAALHAEGLAFEPVAPEGLDETASQMVAALQANLPAQMPAFEQQGYGYYGAIAVPMGVELKPELLSSVANFGTREEAADGVLVACKEQTGADCTVIGMLVPSGS